RGPRSRQWPPAIGPRPAEPTQAPRAGCVQCHTGPRRPAQPLPTPALIPPGRGRPHSAGHGLTPSVPVAYMCPPTFTDDSMTTRRSFLATSAAVASSLAASRVLGMPLESPVILPAPDHDAFVEELALEALNAARDAGASYADARIGRYRR